MIINYQNVGIPSERPLKEHSHITEHFFFRFFDRGAPLPFPKGVT